MKYVRVVFAIQDDAESVFEDYLECVIEADDIPVEFVVDPAKTSNPVQGAHVSAPYFDRETALGGAWTDARTVSGIKQKVAPHPHTDALAEYVTANEVDGPEFLELLVPFLDRTAVRTLCERLDLCPVHHCDVEICADDDVDECRAARS